jgi:hypothetical protein
VALAARSPLPCVAWVLALGLLFVFRLGRLTIAEVNRIERGMALHDVVAILGPSDVENEVDGKTLLKGWRASDGIIIVWINTDEGKVKGAWGVERSHMQMFFIQLGIRYPF